MRHRHVPTLFDILKELNFQDYIANIREKMPELPDATRTRLQKQYGLLTRDVDVLMAVDSGREVGFDGEVGGGAVAYFDQLCQDGERRDPKVVFNWYVTRFALHEPRG